MISRETLGHRLRELRRARGMTLKDVESASGFSATHVSEIERGRTSPTIGALVRVAEALGADPGYFVEARELSSRSVRRAALVPELEETPSLRSRPLNEGVAGGRLRGWVVDLPPDEQYARPDQIGEAGGVVLEGEVRVVRGDESADLRAGDGFHLSARKPYALRNISRAPASVLLVVHRSSLA